MRKAGRRRISWVLALCVALSLVTAAPQTAGAATALAGTGSYLVETEADASTKTAPTAPTVADGFGHEDSDGRIWVDKTVTDKGDGTFDVSLSALAQQYVSSRAASSTTSTVVAADVVFVLDMSSSMNAADVAKPEGQSGSYHRVEAMVRATNQAIKIIMDANPHNRVAVHWFGGGYNGANGVQVGTFMEMGSYTTTTAAGANNVPEATEDFLRWGGSGTNTSANHYVWTSPNLYKDSAGTTYNNSGAAHGASANWGSTSSVGNAKKTENGTPTQSGVTYGIQNAINYITTNQPDPGEVRQPYVFLLSDGAAITASSGWNYTPTNAHVASTYNQTNSSSSNGFLDIYNNQATNGTQTVAAATILGAAFQKEQLEAAYASYSGGAETMFYSVGLGADSAINGASNYAWCGLNPGGLVELYDTGSGNTNNNPAATSSVNTRRQMYTYQNAKGQTGYFNGSSDGTITDPSDPGKFVYTTYYKYANTYPMLDEAFLELSNAVKAATSVVELPVETEDSSGSGSASEAIVFTDVVGDDMEPGAPKIGTYTGHTTDTASPKTYTFGELDSTAIYTTAGSSTTITWNVAATDMARHMYTYVDITDPGEGYDPALPITLTYNVKLADDAADTTTTYYTNAFGGAALTDAKFTPVSDNPYYYYTSTYVGAIALDVTTLGYGDGTGDPVLSHYVQGTTVGTVAGGQALSKLYITSGIAASDSSLTTNMIGTLRDYTVPTGAEQELLDFIAGSIYQCVEATNNTGADGYAFLSGIPYDAGDANLGVTNKEDNETGTVGYSLSDSMTDGKVTALLGNNGRLELQLGISKTATDEVIKGDAISYTITVKNYTASAAENVIVTDAVPSGLTEVTNTTETAVATYDTSSGVPTWTVPSIAAGSSADITFTAKTPTTAATGAEYDNTASITSVGGTAITGGTPPTSKEATTEILQGAEVTVDIEKDGTTWDDGDEPTITLKNVDTDEIITDLEDVPNGTYEIIADGDETGIEVTVTNGGNATETLEYFTLTVNGDGGVSATSGGGIYLKDTAVNVSATLKTGYDFVEWGTTNGDSVVTDDVNPASITVTQTTIIEATTLKTGGEVTVNVNKDGSAWSDHPAIKLVPTTGGGGDITDLESVPNGSYTVWVGDDNTGEIVTVTAGNADGVVTIDYYTVTVNCGDGCHTSSGGGTYRAGVTVNIDTQLNDGYSFDTWTTGDCTLDSATTKNTSFTMPANPVEVEAGATANDNTPYLVRHHVMDTSGVYEYLSAEDEAKTGTTDEVLTLADLKKASLEVTGGIAFGHAEVGGVTETTATVLGDGTLVVDIYYDRSKYKLTLAAGGGITDVTNIVDQEFYYGESISISATVEPDHSFEAWEASTGASNNVTDRETTIIMPANDLTLTAGAVLKRTNVVIDVDKDGSAWTDGTPTITLVPAGGGEPITDLCSVPDGEYKIYANGEDTGKTITVSFDQGTPTINDTLEYFTLTLIPLDGISGVNGGGVYLAGARVDIGAALASGYKFVNWNETGGGTGFSDIKQRNAEIVMPARNLTLEAKAEFVGTSVKVNINKDGSKWTNGAPIITLVPKGGGEPVTDLSAVPDGEYTVYANGEDTGKKVAVKYGETTSPVTLDYYTLTLAAGNGVGSVTGAGVYLAGTQVDISALLAAGYTFAGWTGMDDVISGASATITMPAAALTLTATAVAEEGAADTSSSSSGGQAKTGDDTSVSLYIILIVIAAVAAVATLLYMRKKNAKSK